MEIEGYALTELVKATRLAERLAEQMQGMLFDGKSRTIGDEIAGFLGDVMIAISGEEQDAGNGYDDYKVIRMLRSDMSDGGVAESLNAMLEQRKPKINTVAPDKVRENYEKNGGYLKEPEKTKGSAGIMEAVKAFERLNKVTAMYKACESENVKMRTILLQVAEEKCQDCWRKANGLCGVFPCRWERIKKGDFS